VTVLAHARVEQANSYFCGPATVHMIIAARLGSAPAQPALATATSADGTSRHGIRAALDAHLDRGYRVRALNEGGPLSGEQRKTLLADARGAIDAGFGIAIGVLASHGGPRPAWFPDPRPDEPIDHWVAAFGHDGERLLVTDPAPWGLTGLRGGAESHWISVADLARYTKTYVH
jgi:hypothetical protein